MEKGFIDTHTKSSFIFIICNLNTHLLHRLGNPVAYKLIIFKLSWMQHIFAVKVLFITEIRTVTYVIWSLVDSFLICNIPHLPIFISIVDQLIIDSRIKIKYDRRAVLLQKTRQWFSNQTS